VDFWKEMAMAKAWRDGAFLMVGGSETGLLEGADGGVGDGIGEGASVGELDGKEVKSILSYTSHVEQDSSFLTMALSRSVSSDSMIVQTVTVRPFSRPYQQ
jgi:hypothetical protein